MLTGSRYVNRHGHGQVQSSCSGNASIPYEMYFLLAQPSKGGWPGRNQFPWHCIYQSNCLEKLVEAEIHI